MPRISERSHMIVHGDFDGLRHNVGEPVPVAMDQTPMWFTPLWISVPAAAIFLAIAIYAYFRAEPPAHVGGCIALLASGSWWLIAAQELQFCVWWTERFTWNDPAITDDGTSIDDWAD